VNRGMNRAARRSSGWMSSLGMTAIMAPAVASGAAATIAG
jgi:hypothetical protein